MQYDRGLWRLGGAVRSPGLSIHKSGSVILDGLLDAEMRWKLTEGQDPAHPRNLFRLVSTEFGCIVGEIWVRSGKGEWLPQRAPNLWRSRIRRADGVFRWFHCLGMPFRDSDGRIIRWYDLLTDIDDRKRAEDALRAREHEYREIIDSLPGLVAVWNPDGETEFVNSRLLNYFGTDLEHLQQWRTDG